MIETRNLINKMSISEDSNAMNRKASPGRSMCKQHWRHAGRDKSKSVSPTDGARGAAASVFDSGSPMTSQQHESQHEQLYHQQQEQPVMQTATPSAGKGKKHHRKRGSHHTYYYARGYRLRKDSPRSTMGMDNSQDSPMSSDIHASTGLQTETRNDLLISATESATIQLLDESLPSSLRVQIDMKLPKRDSPASPQISSSHSQSDNDSELDFEFGLENVSFPLTDRTSQDLKTAPMRPLESEGFSFGCSSNELSSITYSKDSMGQDTGHRNCDVNAISDEVGKLSQTFQDQVRLLDVKHENISSMPPSFHQDQHFVVTTNAAGASLLNTLASRTNNSNLSYNYGQSVQFQGELPENVDTGYMHALPLDNSTVSVEDTRIDGNAFMYSMTAPPFVPMSMPTMSPRYWNGQNIPSTESNAIYMSPPHSYPLAYAPLGPNGYGLYNMMPSLPPSSPYYLNHNPAGTNHHALNQPWPLYAPPQTPIQYEQVSVGGTVFFTPVYSPPPPSPMVPPMETAFPAMTLSSLLPSDPHSSHSIIETVDFSSANGDLPTRNVPPIHGSNIHGRKKKRNNKKRVEGSRKEFDPKKQ